MILIRDVGHLLLTEVEAFITLTDDAIDVAHDDIAEAHLHEKLTDRTASRARTVDDDRQLAHLLAGDLHRVQKCRSYNNSGTVLVIVEYEDVALFLQLLLDFEAARSRDVLEVDATEGACEQRNRVDDGVYILRTDAERNRVDATELLKQYTLAFHDRHAGLRADITESEDRGTIRHDRDRVPAAGQLPLLLRILLDLLADRSHARCVGEGQRLGAVDLRARRHLDFTL